MIKFQSHTENDIWRGMLDQSMRFLGTFNLTVESDEAITFLVEIATCMADQMLEEHRKRVPPSGSVSP